MRNSFFFFFLAEPYEWCKEEWVQNQVAVVFKWCPYFVVFIVCSYVLLIKTIFAKKRAIRWTRRPDQPVEHETKRRRQNGDLIRFDEFLMPFHEANDFEMARKQQEERDEKVWWEKREIKANEDKKRELLAQFKRTQSSKQPNTWRSYWSWVYRCPLSPVSTLNRNQVWQVSQQLCKQTKTRVLTWLWNL